MYTATLIPGDGIGPEVTDAAIKVVEAAGVKFEWERHEAGADVVTKYGSPMPDHVLNSIVKNRIALKGPITTPVGTGFSSPNVALRKKLNLYASIRPAKTVPGVKTPFKNVNLVVVRENSEDLYAGLEHIVIPGVVESLKIITDVASYRIAQHAFKLAKKQGFNLVTAVHKANIMKLSDGLFLECCRRASRENPEIKYEELIVDNTCMQLVTHPERFQVMVMENLYGDIISDLASGLVGGLGLTGSVNRGDNCAVYEAVHGSAPDIAGQNLANPTAVIKSCVMMLQDLNETKAAEKIDSALLKVFEAGIKTGDLGGKATTTEFTDAIIANL